MSWLASMCVILTIGLFSYTVYCIGDNLYLRHKQKGIVQSIHYDIKIDDNGKRAAKTGVGTLFFGLLSGFFYYETQRKKKERAGIKEKQERDSPVLLQSAEKSLVSEKTQEAQKKEMSLANETTVNQAVAIHIHNESTSQVAVANIAVEQSPIPDVETTKGQREEIPNKPDKAPGEIDTELQRGAMSDSSEGRPHEYISAQNPSVWKTKEQITRDNARVTIRSRMDNDFCGPQDCIYNRFWVDVDALIKDWPKQKKGLQTRIGQIASLLYNHKNESGQVISHAYNTEYAKYYMSYTKWVKTFFIACGVTPPKNIRAKDFKPIDLETEIPQMKYLRAGSWKYFSDSERIKKYLE